VLETLLRALHPLMPYITEEIRQRVAPHAGRHQAPAGAALPGGRPSIMTAPWPRAADAPRDAAAERDIAWIQQVVLGIRQIRGEMDISPAKKLPLLLENATDADRQCATEHRAFLERLAGLESLRLLDAGDTAPPSATALVGDMKVLVPMAGLIDARAELERLGKRRAKAEAELAKARAKLGNENFVRNAPAEVVAQENARIADFETQLRGFDEQAARVRALLEVT
jgi:valyl-tRNA synthetase